MIDTVAIGVSAGGLNALSVVLPKLPGDLGLTIVIVQHVHEDSDNYMAEHLDGISAICVQEAAEKSALQPGHAYIAPPGYHLLVEEDRTFSLNADPPVNYARPSVDVFFESAAEVFEDKLVGIILTGANSDGARGLAAIKEAGGLAVVQDPVTAESSMMPSAAIEAIEVDHIFELSEIASFICALDKEKKYDGPNPVQKVAKNGK